jgi:nucleoside-diphosphate-sugar epimerase
VGVNSRPDQRFDEESPYNPYLHYGRSKFLMEQFVQGCSVESVIIRSPWFYGPHQPARQVLFCEMIRKGKVPLVGDGENYRSMAYVDNISSGILQALHTPAAAGKIYWIADAMPYKMKEIIDAIEEVLEKDFHIPCRHRRIRLPGFVSNLAYGMDACLQAIGLYNQKIHVLSEMNRTIACSIQKAQRELQYFPSISLREGMRRSIACAIERNQLRLK